MEDFIGLIIFVVFVVLSVAGKAMRGQGGEKGRRAAGPQWPGPVARPGLPGYPKPAWPQAPSRPQAGPISPTALDDFEGVGTEGIPTEGNTMGDLEGTQTEGPRVADSVQVEVERFDNQAGELIRHHLKDLQGGLKDTQEYPVVQAGPRVSVGLSRALTDQTSLAQAVVLAEVLGKPKGLRRVQRR